MVLLALGMVGVWLAAGCSDEVDVLADSGVRDAGLPADGGLQDSGSPADGGVQDAGPTCMAPQQECDGGCVDTSSSVDHCGSCGLACKSGYACADGDCHPDCQGNFDGSVVAFTFSEASPRTGLAGTQYVITLGYTIQQPVAAVDLTFVVTDINGTVVTSQTVAVSDLTVGDHTTTMTFDSTGQAPGFYTGSTTACAPGSGSEIGATVRVDNP